MIRWRIIKLNSYDAYTNFAFDNAILEDVIKGGNPTIRFYKFDEITFSVGSNQNQHLINKEICEKDNIRTIRRKTEGGVLFHGMDELHYSFIAPATIFSNVEESYRKILTPIIKVLKSLKIEVRIGNENDLVVDHRKISLNSQIKEEGVLFLQGKILFNPDIKNMQKYLENNLTLKEIKEKVVGVSEFSDISFEELYERILGEFLIGKEYNFSQAEELKKRILEILADKKTEDISQGEERYNSYFR